MERSANEPDRAEGELEHTVSAVADEVEVGSAATPFALPVIDPQRYQVLGEFARGGLGRILKVKDLRLGRIVALKEMLGDSAKAYVRFAREALLTPDRAPRAPSHRPEPRDRALALGRAVLRHEAGVRPLAPAGGALPHGPRAGRGPAALPDRAAGARSPVLSLGARRALAAPVSRAGDRRQRGARVAGNPRDRGRAAHRRRARRRPAARRPAPAHAGARHPRARSHRGAGLAAHLSKRWQRPRRAAPPGHRGGEPRRGAPRHAAQGLLHLHG